MTSTHDPRPEEQPTAPVSPEDGMDPPEEISIVSEFFWFVRENKKWWLIPLIVVFLLLALLILLSSNPATAPFIYTIF